MTGNPDVGYDDDQQQTVAPKVIESWDAVTGSRKRRPWLCPNVGVLGTRGRTFGGAAHRS